MDREDPQIVRDDLVALAEAGTRNGARRIERVDTQHGTFWIKRPEKLSPRMRLQKGNPAKAFERERQGFRDMTAAQAPVPELIAESPDYIILPDCGRDLRKLLKIEPSAERRRELLLDAMGALGTFHNLGFAHGRPSPKDMCLYNGRVVLLDFERYDVRRNTMSGQARDLVVFVFNVMAHSPMVVDDLPEALDAYRAVAPAGVWNAAQAWCHRMKWAAWLTKPIQMRRGEKAREFKAIPAVIEMFARES